MSVGLEEIDFCISELSQKGMIKSERFKKSKNKLACMYRQTPHEFEELVTLTLSFLKMKIKGYDRIRTEVKSLLG